MAAAGLLLGFLVVWLRIAWLQIARHGYYAGRAERNQEQHVLVRPERGRLLDRFGHVLARDVVSYSVSAAPREMADPRGTARDLARVLGLDPRRLEREFARRPRFLWVTRRADPNRGLAIAAWNRHGVYVSPETRRADQLGDAACEIIGRTNLDDIGVDGLELELDDELRGRPGWSTLFRDGRGLPHALPGGQRRRPEDGRDVVLTLDEDIQSIAENHLARAVDTLRAARGFALFLDPRTGEVLASVNVPHLPPGKARNWNFTDQFEPGSTFKVVAASGALEEGIARPDQVFEASADGKALLAPGAVFHDVHKQAAYSFRDAIRWSSNIVMGKLGLLLGPERLYRYATTLGFGGITGIAFPGEAGGKLRSPSHWSARSCPTIAIGHEISVTPIQLALAYAAIANGGLLMEPMLVREVREPDGTVVRRSSPRATQRVLGARTTELLRGMLAAVVDSGTAKAARIPGLSIGGKTGTAQKYDAALGTYRAGKYLSSFVGFAPADNPSLVGVVVIDEPGGRKYYGGEVAAPVFREILLDLHRLWRDDFRGDLTAVAAPPPSPAPVVVPDVHLLLPDAAARRLREFGLRASFQSQGARVLAQQPAAGTEAERGGAVALWLSAPDDSGSRVLPDVTQLTLREALRRLAPLEVRAIIAGSGTVVRQSPAPGTPLPLERGLRLWCEEVVLRPTAVVPETARLAASSSSGTP